VPDQQEKDQTAPIKDHLEYLLPPADLEKPWFMTFYKSVKEAINPPKLPPLEITSKPVPLKEIKIYAGNEAKAGLSSLAIHVSVVALMFFLGSLKPVQKAVKDTITLIAPDLKPYLAAAPKKQQMGGGGGGGTRAPLDASKGKLPKLAPKQFTPPRVDPIENPKLPVLPTLVAQDAPLIAANNLGDPLSRLGVPSNGSGLSGIGSGTGGGVGAGKGAGVGAGSGGGFGGGVYRIGGGVSAPAVLLKIEPEYSEEARKAKWQGTVVLSLIVDDKGQPQELKVVRALGLGLDQKAIEAVTKWRFKPGMKDGKPVAVQATIEVNFRLL
jgi:protein TonB